MKMLEPMRWQTSYTYYDENFKEMTTVGWLRSDEHALAYFTWLASLSWKWRSVTYVTRRGSENGKINRILPFKYDAATDTVCLID